MSSLLSDISNTLQKTFSKTTSDVGDKLIRAKDSIHSSIFKCNGKIDENVYQGAIGDCWLISGVLALNNTDEGKEIIKNAISKTSDGKGYEVYFKGVDKSYTVSKEELKQAEKVDSNKNKNYHKYSSGDDDMLLIELATEKLVKDESVKNNLPYIMQTNGIDGGYSYNIFNLLAGINLEDTYVIHVNDFEKYDWDIDENTAIILSSGGYDSLMAGELKGHHAYVVKSIDQKNDEIVLTDPANTQKDITEKISKLHEEAQLQFSKMPEWNYKEDYEY